MFKGAFKRVKSSGNYISELDGFRFFIEIIKSNNYLLDVIK